VPKPEADTLPIHPLRLGHLGATKNIAQVAGGVSDYTQIQSGPNTGMWYFTDSPVEAESWIYVNYAAMSLNSDFYLRQPINGPATKCKRVDVLPFVPVVEVHEGRSEPPPSMSHAGVFRDTLNAIVPQVTENLFNLSLATLFEAAELASAQPIARARQRAGDMPPNGSGIVPPAQWYCTFKYF
jgi:hypothetical protein